jgi:hypothetical protein
MTRRIALVFAAMTIGLGDTLAQPTPQWPEVTREMKPGSRWWWPGSAVDETNLERNIQAYARAGIGTLEITPIYGVTGNEKNERSYLSQSWMEALKASQQTGETAGVDIDMNGGTGWPFGGPWVKQSEAAGKLVTKNTTLDANGKDTLTFDVRSPEGNAPLAKVMAFQQDGEQAVADVTEYVDDNKLKWTAPAGQWLLIAVYNGHTGQQVKRAAPGGEGLVLDHYDADAVANYLAHFDKRFEATGAQWPHTFFNDSYEVYGADWTPKMFAEFEKYRGYKLEEHMDRLLALGKRKDTGNQVLADYRQTLSDMLLNNFTRQWTAWAHSHGATTRNQGHGSPGNLIDFYAAVDIPEIESFGITDFKIRGLRTDPGFTSQNLSDVATLKYASSAAHVTGKRLVSSETFTWLAEHFRVSLSQMKPDLDQMFIAGVNHIFFHGTTYSPQEAAWPGWKFYASIDMSPTNSIWRDAPAMMQYATRCQSFLQNGLPDNDVLVYAPFCDAMHKNTGSNAARLQLFDINTLSQKMPSMVTTVKNLEAAGLDCDFISDNLLLTTTCTGGLLQTAAGTQYKALVIPVTSNMPEAVKTHLNELETQGAKIIYKNDAASIAALGIAGEEMRTLLGLRAIRRKTATGYHYFIANLSPKDIEGYCSLAVPFTDAWLYNPMTGGISLTSADNGKVWMALKSGQSIILQTHNEGSGGSVMPETTDVPVHEMAGIAIDTPWTLSFTDSTYSDKTLQTYSLDHPQSWEGLDEATATAMGTGIYETTFSISRSLMDMANAGIRIDLGDVRESARVYINNEYAGCAWSAPFVIDGTGRLHEGDNTLRIEVTNLPANRIRQMDIDGKQWRIFKDVNILDIANGNNSQAGITYEKWDLVPSGLNASVRLIPLRRLSTELTARLVGFAQQGEDYYPTYRVSAPSGLAIEQLSIIQEDGTDFTGYTYDTANCLLTISAASNGYVTIRATDSAGTESATCMRAYGAYDQQRTIDFTADEAPACGWQVMTNETSINGFAGNYAWRRAPEKNSTTLAQLTEGVTAESEKPTYYFYYPTRGMAATNDFTLRIAAQEGDIALLSYVVGSPEKPAYNAADSLLSVKLCEKASEGIAYDLPSRNSYYLCRYMAQYRPRTPFSMTTSPHIRPAQQQNCYYTLQGIRVSAPRQGIYIRDGKKVFVKQRKE